MNEQRELLPINPLGVKYLHGFVADTRGSFTVRGVFALGRGAYEGKVFAHYSDATSDLAQSWEIARRKSTREEEFIVAVNIDIDKTWRYGKRTYDVRSLGLWAECNNGLGETIKDLMQKGEDNG